jgi:hypothetical protein
MSVDSKKIGATADLPFENSTYDDDLALDLEMEQIIKRLDEITQESDLPKETQSPAKRDQRKTVLTAKQAHPVENQQPARPEANTILLTERLESQPNLDVIDLVDEIDHGPESDSKGALKSIKVAELTAQQLSDIIAGAVEAALRKFYSR